MKQVLAFAFVAIFIPIYPHIIEVTAPVINAVVVNAVPGTASAYTNISVPKKIMKKARYRYSWNKKTSAPSLITCEIAVSLLL